MSHYVTLEKQTIFPIQMKNQATGNAVYPYLVQYTEQLSCFLVWPVAYGG